MIPGARNEVRVFFTVLLIAVIALTLYISNRFGTEEGISGEAIRPTTEKITNTIGIKGINIGDNIGKNLPALTEFHLLGLADGAIITKEGIARYKQFIRLTSPDVFDGGTLFYGRNEEDLTGDYLFFNSDEALLEYGIVFSAALESKMEDKRLEDLEGEYIAMLGGTYVFQDVKIDTNRNSVSLKIFGVGNLIEFEDNYADNLFSQGVKINGHSVNAFVNIQGQTSGDIFKLSSIAYRPFADAKVGNDVYVIPKHGLREFLQEPNVLLSPSFDIIYGGLKQEQIKTRPLSSGNILHFKPRGDDGYRLLFNNNLGQRYNIHLVDRNQNGDFKYGESGRDLIYVEGSGSGDFNINQGAYFIVTSNEGVNGVTSVLKYSKVDIDTGILYFDDLGGSSKTANFNTATGEGTLSVSGQNYDFFVDLSSPHPIVVDLNGNGAIVGDEARIVIFGGPRLDLGSSNTIQGGEITVRLTTPARLFDEPSSDEVVNLRIFLSGDKVDLEVTSGVTLKKDDKSELKIGTTNFGNFFILNDNKESAELEIEFPIPGSKRMIDTKIGGQLKGLIIVTLERETLLKIGEEG